MTCTGIRASLRILCFASALLLSTPAWARQPREELTICARVGTLLTTSGAPVAFGRYVLPPLWSVRRDVRFQVCAPDGRPRPGRLSLEVTIEPLTPDIGAAGVASYSVSTDDQGRFSGVYGAGNRGEGPAWPEGVTSLELHHFRLDGRTVATFAVEREARDIRIYRP